MRDSVHVVCPHCDAVNRVPPGRPPESGKCGKCHRRLFEGRPVALDERRLKVHRDRGDLPLLVDFWAPWCGPCRTMAPAFEKAAGLLEPRLRLGKLNTDEEQALSARLGIRSIPTLVLFARGQEIARVAGAMEASRLIAWVDDHLPAAD